jgi:uncharacterized protein involved in tolerance to divalent cations
LQNYVVSQNNCEEENERGCLYDSAICITTVNTGKSNEKQITKKKYRFNLCLCCFKSKYRYQNKLQKNDEINQKIKIKSENNFDQTRTRNTQDIFSIEGMTPLQMNRRSSASTQRISAPIILCRRHSEENGKSQMYLHRKSFAENVKSAVLLSRIISAENVQSPILFSPKSSATEDWEGFLSHSRKL